MREFSMKTKKYLILRTIWFLFFIALHMCHVNACSHAIFVFGCDGCTPYLTNLLIEWKKAKDERIATLNSYRAFNNKFYECKSLYEKRQEFLKQLSEEEKLNLLAKEKTLLEIHNQIIRLVKTNKNFLDKNISTLVNMDREITEDPYFITPLDTGFKYSSGIQENFESINPKEFYCTLYYQGEEFLNIKDWGFRKVLVETYNLKILNKIFVEENFLHTCAKDDDDEEADEYGEEITLGYMISKLDEIIKKESNLQRCETLNPTNLSLQQVFDKIKYEIASAFLSPAYFWQTETALSGLSNYFRKEIIIEILKKFDNKPLILSFNQASLPQASDEYIGIMNYNGKLLKGLSQNVNQYREIYGDSLLSNDLRLQEDLIWDLSELDGCLTKMQVSGTDRVTMDKQVWCIGIIKDFFNNIYWEIFNKIPPKSSLKKSINKAHKIIFGRPCEVNKNLSNNQNVENVEKQTLKKIHYN